MRTANWKKIKRCAPYDVNAIFGTSLFPRHMVSMPVTELKTLIYVYRLRTIHPIFFRFPREVRTIRFVYHYMWRGRSSLVLKLKQFVKRVIRIKIKHFLRVIIIIQSKIVSVIIIILCNH